MVKKSKKNSRKPFFLFLWETHKKAFFFFDIHEVWVVRINTGHKSTVYTARGIHGCGRNLQRRRGSAMTRHSRWWQRVWGDAAAVGRVTHATNLAAVHVLGTCGGGRTRGLAFTWKGDAGVKNETHSIAFLRIPPKNFFFPWDA